MIVITGPGRSGTSLLAHLYRALGFDPGGAWDDTRSAGFEEAETVALNTELCDELRAPMGNPPVAAPGEQRWDLMPELADRYGSRMRAIATGREVVKDPRFCWTLGVWLRASAHIEHVVLSFRRIDDMMRSAKHAGMIDDAKDAAERDLMRAVRMYRMGSALAAVGEHDVPHTLLWFPRFLDDPARLHDCLVFPRPVERDEFVAAFERTVNRDLVRFNTP